MALIIDTGPLLASFDESDDHHAPCLKLLRESRDERLIPAPVLVEVDYWLSKRFMRTGISALLRDIEDGWFRVVDLVPSDYRRVRILCEQYRDARLGLVDASVISVAERLGEPKVATIDHRHFRMVRPVHVDALTLLP